MHNACAGMLMALALWPVDVVDAVPMDPPPTDAPRKGKQPPAPKPDAVAALIAALGAADWQARDKALRELVALGNAARPALRQATRSQDAEVRWRATYALSLLDIALEPAQTDAARVLYASAARARAQADGLEAARQLYAEVLERFPNTRWAEAARERLAAPHAPKATADRQATTPEAIQQLISSLGQAAWAERQRASRELAALGAAARPALEAAAQSADPEIAWRAQALLHRLQPPEELAVAKPRAEGKRMVEVLGQGAPHERRELEPNDLDALARTLSSDDAGDVARAREVLLNLGSDAVPPLLRALEACDETSSVEIIDLLRQITRQPLGYDPALWQAWWRDQGERGPR